MLVILYNPIPRGVAPQQSSAMLQTAGQRYIIGLNQANVKKEKAPCNLSY